MSGIFPNTADGGLAPNATDTNNPSHAYDPNTEPLNTAALYYGNGCDVRLRPEVVNALISEVEGVVDVADVAYNQARLDNLQRAARFLIQRGKPRSSTLTGPVNAWTGVLDPVSTAYNDLMTLSLTAPVNNTAAITLNFDVHGAVPLLRNDGKPMQKDDIIGGVPFESIYWHGSFYMVGLVASQVTFNLQKAGFANGCRVFYNPGQYGFIVPPDVTRVFARVWGGGGSGGGQGGGNGHAASGGGGGGYVEGLVTGLTPGMQILVTVGAGGYQVFGANWGIPGGVSSFGSYMSALGGAPGMYGTTGTYIDGTGTIGQIIENPAIGIGGQVDIQGGRGGGGGVAWLPGVWTEGGMGGSAGFGGQGGPRNSSGGQVGTQPGGGGSGAGGGVGSSTWGGPGAYGMVILQWVDPNLP
jgi:hypothetical protein